MPWYVGSVSPHPVQPRVLQYDLENREVWEYYQIYPRAANGLGKTSNGHFMRSYDTCYDTTSQ